MNYSELMVIMPELALLGTALTWLIFGLILPSRKDGVIRLMSFVVLILASCLFAYGDSFYGSAFSKTYVNNSYTIRFKAFILAAGSMIVLASAGHFKNVRQKNQDEFFVLFLLSVLGSFVAISARDLIVLFVGLELQSLPAYILAAFARDSIKSSEAGLKYFILGSLASAILLFGSSLVYGFTGTVSYYGISYFILHSTNIGVLAGVSMIIIALMFKLSVAPFHMWTPDVYEGSPIMSVTIFASVQKLASLGIFVTLIAMLLSKFAEPFVPVIKFFAVCSLIVGSLGAIFQNTIKRLMAYSAILNIGYVLLAIIADLYIGVWRHAFFTYMIIYAVSTIAFFSLLAAVFGKRADDLTMQDLHGLGEHRKWSAAALTVLIFSMIGIPPMAGFFGKYYVLYDLIAIEEYGLVLMAVLASVVAAYYYLRIVKTIYFDSPEITLPQSPVAATVVIVVSSSIIFVISFAFVLAGYFSGLEFIVR